MFLCKCPGFICLLLSLIIFNYIYLTVFIDFYSTPFLIGGFCQNSFLLFTVNILDCQIPKPGHMFQSIRVEQRFKTTRTCHSLGTWDLKKVQVGPEKITKDAFFNWRSRMQLCYNRIMAELPFEINSWLMPIKYDNFCINGQIVEIRVQVSTCKNNVTKGSV